MRFLLIGLLWLATAAQATVPTLNSSTPTDNATGVSQTTDLVLNFGQKLTAVSGKNIKIYQSGGSLVESVDVTSAQVSITNGDKRVTVDFNTALSGGTDYYILIDSGAFTNNGDPYPGISDSTELNFTTLADTTAPTVTFSPSSGATGVAANSNLILTFDESIRHTNDSAITNTSVDALITLKEDNSSGADIAFDATISGNVITIDPSSNFSSEQVVYVAIGATVEDDADNAITASSATFTVVDTAPPTIATSPLDGATGVSHNVHVEFIFNENIRLLDNTALSDKNNNNNINALITLKEDNASGADIAFSAIIDYENDGTVKLEAFLEEDLASLQTVYAALAATQLEDEFDNAVASDVSFTFTTGELPHYETTYPRTLQKNIGIDANITIEFEDPVYVDSSGSNRKITIYNRDTGLQVTDGQFQANSEYITGAGTRYITINPPNDLEERVNYYVIIENRAFKGLNADGSYSYFPGISDSDTLTFKTAKDPNKYPDIVASNETHVNHSMNQVESSIAAVANRQNFIRRNGGRNRSHQGIKFKFNNEQLDQTLNQLNPLIQHFEQYDLNKQLANAADKVLPNGWGLWTSGEISIGDTNSKNGSDSSSHSRELTIGLDKNIDQGRMLGGSYRVNTTDTTIGSAGTKMDSNTKSWSLYGSLDTSERNTFEGLIGWGDIKTAHTRIDGANTYTGVRESKQIFGCFIARENHKFKDVDLSPFIRIDTSYTKQESYSETGTGDTAYDALHYKANKFHNSIVSVGLDASTQLAVGDKTIKPYLSLRHQLNTGYESSNVMYYLSNPIKEYTQNIASDSAEKGFNLVVGADIHSQNDWLITASYELNEAGLTFNKGIRFRAEWKF